MAYLRFRELRDYRLPFSSSETGKYLSAQWDRTGSVMTNEVRIVAEPLPDCNGEGLEAGIPVFPVRELVKARRRQYDKSELLNTRRNSRLRKLFAVGKKWLSRRQALNVLRTFQPRDSILWWEQ